MIWLGEVCYRVCRQGVQGEWSDRKEEAGPVEEGHAHELSTSLDCR